MGEAAEVVAKTKGSALSGLIFRHPFYERQSPVFVGEHVTDESGTGLVHTAPGHGEEDFHVGLAMVCLWIRRWTQRCFY